MGRFRYVLLTANIVALLGVLVSPAAMFVAAFIFDDPRAAYNPLAYGMLLSVWSYPFSASYGGYRALKAYKAGEYHKTYNWTYITYSAFFMYLGFMFAFIVQNP